jgi:TPR repeat protein
LADEMRAVNAIAPLFVLGFATALTSYGQSESPSPKGARAVYSRSAPPNALTLEFPSPNPSPMFAITEVKTTDLPYPKDAEKSFILSVKVTKQASEDIDPSKVQMQVSFYDTVDHQEIKPSRAGAAQDEWLKGTRPKPDWRQKTPETLTVYTRFKSPERPSRDYLGCRVLVYYNNRLQDQRADPPNLSRIFPALPFAVPPSYSHAQKALARNDYDAAVSLLQEPVEQGYAPSQAQLASLYAQGKGVPRDYGKALELFQKAVDQGFQPRVLNDFAWFLATCPDASRRNGKQAVDYANQACVRTHWKTASMIDTLAAAYAETGDFDTAIKCEKQAMGIPGTGSADKQRMEQRIELYSHHEPYRQP